MDDCEISGLLDDDDDMVLSLTVLVNVGTSVPDTLVIDVTLVEGRAEFERLEKAVSEAITDVVAVAVLDDDTDDVKDADDEDDDDAAAEFVIVLITDNDTVGDISLVSDAEADTVPVTEAVFDDDVDAKAVSVNIPD